MIVFKRFWNDECGATLSAELILITTLVVLGMIVGLATFRDSVVQELGDTAMAVGVLNQSYEMSTSLTGNADSDFLPTTAQWEFGHIEEGTNQCNPYVGVFVRVYDSSYEDNNDFCDNNADGAEGVNAEDPEGAAPACIMMNVTTDLNEGPAP